MIMQFFNDLFTNALKESRQLMHWGQFPTLVVTDRRSLELDVIMDHVRATVFDMAPYKSLGPDGFPPFFFPNQWDLVKKDVFKIFKPIFKGEISIGLVNNTF